MKYCRDQKQSTGLTIHAITGDGAMERNILEILAKKYNGNNKTICFPNPPFNPFKKRQGRSGLSILDIIQIIAGKWNINNYIYLVDREHVGDYPDIQDYLSKFMNNLTLDRNIINGRYGGHNINIYCSIMGTTRRIEENFTELIRIRVGDNIRPEKTEIRDYLKNELNTDIKDFIDQSTKNQIRRAFPDLSNVMESLEDL